MILVGVIGIVALLCLSVYWANKRGDRLWSWENEETEESLPPPQKDIECLNCQAVIRVGQTKCKKCGWDYTNDNNVV
jgi:uncharacterized paraquat-inducible protein A